MARECPTRLREPTVDALHEGVDLLRRARALIERDGWNWRRLGHREIGFCAVGAIYEVADTLHDERAKIAELLLASMLPDAYRLAKPIPSITCWSMWRTKREALDLFDVAIRRALEVTPRRATETPPDACSLPEQYRKSTRAMGDPGLEPGTSSLSERRSDRLS